MSAYPLQPLFYKRFIDDGYGIWTHSQEQLEMFLEYANTIDIKIQVKMRSSKEKIEFLDTMVNLNQERNLKTDVYTKPTDKHMFIN